MEIWGHQVHTLAYIHYVLMACIGLFDNSSLVYAAYQSPCEPQFALLKLGHFDLYLLS